MLNELRLAVEKLRADTKNFGEISAYNKVLMIVDALDTVNLDAPNHNHFTLETPQSQVGPEFKDYDHPV